jgi:formamidopyrimidine-DNA glycosylase
VPELPEVETVRRQLAPRLAGRRIVAAGALESPKFTPAHDAVGSRFDDLRRRGKYLLAGLDDGRELIVHLGMTGALSLRPLPVEPGHPHVRAWWDLDDGRRLVMRDVRRFGRVHVVRRGDHRTIPTLREIGPEPFDPAFTPAALHAALARSRRPVKTQLLSQRPVAGIGNIYADEALWRARIRPSTRRLGPARAAALHGALRAVLAAALADGGTTLRDYRDATGARGGHQHRLACYGRGGEPCVACGRQLVAAVLDGRTTTFCPRCQAR